MPYATARKRDVNFGDRVPIRGADTQPLAEISVDQSLPFTIYASALRVDPPTAPVIPLVSIEWGHGGASISARELPVYRRLRVPVVGSTVRVSGRMVTTTGAPPDRTTTCHMVAFVAPGSDGEANLNTQWIAQTGAEGLISDGPEQLLALEGYPSTLAPPRWLMVFDAIERPGNGTFPPLAVPVRRTFRQRRFNSQGFRFGVYWAASSTPLTFTFDPTAALRVDVELLA
jgi:hypothetical protein